MFGSVGGGGKRRLSLPPSRVHPKAEKREERESLFLSLSFHPASRSSLAWEVFQSGTNRRKCHTLAQKSVFISKLPFQRLSKKKMECNAYSSFQIWVSSDKCCFVFSVLWQKKQQAIALAVSHRESISSFPFFSSPEVAPSIPLPSLLFLASISALFPKDGIESMNK